MIYVTQKKLHAKKEEKLLKRFWDRPPPSILTDGRTDGRTDRRTDRRTTDKSVLEKLRCLSAGGAKNVKYTLCIVILSFVTSLFFLPVYFHHYWEIGKSRPIYPPPPPQQAMHNRARVAIGESLACYVNHSDSIFSSNWTTLFKS